MYKKALVIHRKDPQISPPQSWHRHGHCSKSLVFTETFTPTAHWQESSSPTGSLLDPITAKERQISHVPTDKLLEYHFFDRLAHRVKTLFVTLPKTVIKGLRGDADFNFSDFTLLSSIPYYLGGAFLTYSFIAGKDRSNAIRQGVGVGLYYLGILLSHHLIDRLFQYRYGVDLSLKYRRADGRVDSVFGSVDFPRFDLLPSKMYRQIQEKMGIPSSVSDRDHACREQLFRILSASRSMKLLLGNVLAAIGAGYLARTDRWLRLFTHHQTLKNIWTLSSGHSFGEKISKSLQALKAILSPIVVEKCRGLPGESSPWLRRLTWGGLFGILALCVVQSLNVLTSKQYESAQATGFLKVSKEGYSLSPENTPIFNYLKTLQQGHPNTTPESIRAYFRGIGRYE